MRRAIPGIVAALLVFACTVGPRTWALHGGSRDGDPGETGRTTESVARGALSARNANYTIAVRLDPAAHALHGRETIEWRNISRASTSELRFHLYYNAWRNLRSTFFREAALAGERFPPPDEADLGWTDVTAIRLVSAGRDSPAGTDDDSAAIDLIRSLRFIEPDDGNGDDRTVASVALPREIGPGQSVTVELEWTARVPRTVARTGFAGNYYFLAQWFPKIGVLEDVGWNCHQFHASTEFFADYGVYDVSMTVPAGWTVGASGRELGRRDEAGGTTTWRYLAEDVHDFAWTTSPDYVERYALFQAPGLPPVRMRLLLQPEHLSQAARHLRATEAALRYYGTWFGAYPYPDITIVDPAWQSGAGGMEYPTLFTAGARWLAPEGATTPEHVTVHECGHQFWYALVGNNEFEDAWLDEGLNTYSTARVIDEVYRDSNHLASSFFGGFVPFVFRDFPLGRVDGEWIALYRQSARIDVPATASWRYWPAAAGALSYGKAALWLHTLENYVGWPTFRRCLATYFERWRFRHPKPADFFQVMNEVSGRDLTWFFDQVYRDTRVFDYGIDALQTAPAPAGAPSQASLRSTVVVRRYGDGIFPVDLIVRFADGSSARENWDGRDQWKAFTFDRRVEVVSAEVDPEQVLALDVNRANNSRLAQPEAGRAATRWAAGWIVWLQDWLLNCANFV